jgi:hypothetical protein
MLNGKNRVQPERQWSGMPEYQGTSGWMDRWMSGAVCQRMDGWTGGYVDQWMVDQCASGWAEQCANGWMDQRICSVPTSGDLQAGNLQAVISKQAKRWSLTFVTS